MARLDNFAIALQASPQNKGLIIFYGGRRFRGRLPRQGEAQARAARLKPYLVQRRGIPANQINVVDGGYDEEWHVELWIIPPAVKAPEPDSRVPLSQIRFRKGKVNPRDYRCHIG
jgi:hypothetical protein